VRLAIPELRHDSQGTFLWLWPLFFDQTSLRFSEILWHLTPQSSGLGKRIQIKKEIRSRKEGELEAL